MKRFALPLTLVGLAVAVLVGLAIGVPVGQNNPATPPTPAPPPSNPAEWLTGIATGKIQIPAVLMGGTMKVEFGLGNCAPFRYEGPQNAAAATFVIAYAQECGDADLDIAALLKSVGLGNFNIPANLFKRAPKPVAPPAPVKWSSNPDGSCTVEGPVDLVRDCLTLSRDGMANLHPALPDLFPPAVELPEKFGWASTTENGTKYTAYGYNNVEPLPGAVITFERDNGIRVDTKNVYVNYKISTYAFVIQTWGSDQLMINYTDKQTGQMKSEIWSISELFPKF